MEKQKTIFLVDDASSNLKLGSDLLSEYYTVFTLDSGKRMFKLIQKIRPDLILLDINMPEMDGYEVIRRLKADPATTDIPVIFLTAYDSDENEIRGFDLGALDYITKPFSAPRLLKRIELQLIMEDQRRELANYSLNLEKMVHERTEEAVNLKNVFVETMTDLVEHRVITDGHIRRTQRYIEVLLHGMRERGVYMEEVANICISLAMQSSQLHDIGKIAVRDVILMKPGPLTPEEFNEMKIHTKFGGEVISRIQAKALDSEFLEYAKIFAESHHEKWDGTGYHQGLAGADIPLLGRIMAIADVYDALVTKRPYKGAYSHQAAVDIIKKDSGTHFDPALVDVFMEIHEEFDRVTREEAARN
ncbi:MAG: response regulator [Clostridiales bacterium]|nr:response regulator [Clostridiales bacterium]